VAPPLCVDLNRQNPACPAGSRPETSRRIVNFSRIGPTERLKTTSRKCPLVLPRPQSAGSVFTGRLPTSPPVRPRSGPPWPIVGPGSPPFASGPAPGPPPPPPAGSSTRVCPPAGAVPGPHASAPLVPRCLGGGARGTPNGVWLNEPPALERRPPPPPPLNCSRPPPRPGVLGPHCPPPSRPQGGPTLPYDKDSYRAPSGASPAGG